MAHQFNIGSFGSIVSQPRTFSTGSTGEFGSGKVSIPALQTSITVTVPGVGTLIANPRTFKTGNTGYYGTGKLVVDGKQHQCSVTMSACKGDVTRLQCSVQMVLIGSKPEKRAAKASKASKLEAQIAKLNAQLRAIKA